MGYLYSFSLLVWQPEGFLDSVAVITWSERNFLEIFKMEKQLVIKGTFFKKYSNIYVCACQWNVIKNKQTKK